MKRLFKKGYPNHVYCKGIDGNTVFYSIADCLYYITLYSCLSRRYRIRTNAFSLMPNHTHSQQEADDKRCFCNYNQELQSKFTIGYNNQHGRNGELFEKPFGSVPKIGEKYIKNNLSYINNNGAAGRLSEGVMDYRWNLMAYHDTDHPFSEKIVLNRASQHMRQAMKFIARLRKENKPLDYKIQDILFKGLNGKEARQLIDFIIVRYNFLDYRSVIQYFGSFENALLAMDANTGSEHDLKEEWEDYSEYRAMTEVCQRSGYRMEDINFKLLEKDDLLNLVLILSSISKDKKKILRFLHLKGSQAKAFPA